VSATLTGLGDAEVGDDCSAPGQHHVVGFDVAMDDAVFVRVAQSARHIAQHAQRIGDGQGAALAEPLAERLPVLVRHHEEQRVADLA
jgi:hypothetical protein